MKFIILLISFAVYIITLTYSIKLIQPATKRKILSGDNIGLGLYHGQVVTQTMKRPQKWFFNVMMQKPNDRYFREAEYNGLRYQTELLQDNLEKEYNDYKRDLHEEKLNIYEQNMINAIKIQKKMKK